MKREKKSRILKGTIVSDKMQKTAVVAVMRLKKHPKYHKYFHITKRYKAHDAENAYHSGDTVLIQEIRPLSKDKRWRIISSVKKSGGM